MLHLYTVCCLCLRRSSSYITILYLCSVFYMNYCIRCLVKEVHVTIILTVASFKSVSRLCLKYCCANLEIRLCNFVINKENMFDFAQQET